MGKLSDKGVQAAKPKEKQYKMADGDGLTLVIKPNGSKLWWFRYRFSGKEKTLALGEYPIRTLLSAREAALSARRLLQDGIDPMQHKAESKAAIVQKEAQKEHDAASSFQAVATEWFEKFKTSQNWEPNHSSKIWGLLNCA